MRILFIEDERPARSGLTVVLRTSGHTVDVAESVRDAEKFLTVEAYDYLVLDLMLPVGEPTGGGHVLIDAGVFLLRDIRQRRIQDMKTDPNVPVVVVTAVSSNHTLLMLSKYPNVEVAQKPIDPEDVLRIMTRVRE